MSVSRRPFREFPRMYSKELSMPRVRVNNKALNKEYIDSGRWKCNKSPSGAHYWIIIHDQMKCKHCNEHRQVLVPSNLTFQVINTKGPPPG